MTTTTTISTSDDRWPGRLRRPGGSHEIKEYFHFENLTYEAEFSAPEDRVDNLEYDLRTTEWILEKVRGSESYAQNLYAALCNNEYIRLEVISILLEKQWSCSWRHAGGIIANMRREGDYLNWYCSGITSSSTTDESGSISEGISEGVVSDEIRDDLIKLGWAVRR